MPTSVPAPSFNPSVINIYTPAESDAAAAGEAQDLAASPTAASTGEQQPAPKGGRILTPVESQQPAKVAGLFTMQPQNPAAVPLPSEPPVQDFNAGRFSQPQAQAQEKTAALQPANPLRLQTPQPANPLSQTPDDGSRPVAKLNAFFPPKPAPAAVEGEGDDGDSADDSSDDSEPAGLMRLISAPGLARVAPNGIWIQTPYVETDCFKPELMKMLHTVEKHYGKPPIVTSGYRRRSGTQNRVARNIRCTRPAAPPTFRSTASPNGNSPVTFARCPSAAVSAPTAIRTPFISTRATSATGIGVVSARRRSAGNVR